MYSKELIKGTLRTVILRLLDGEGRLYGYQMSKLVKERSDGNYQLSEGSLYPLLHKLVQDGLVVTETETVNGRVRRHCSWHPFPISHQHACSFRGNRLYFLS